MGYLFTFPFNFSLFFHQSSHKIYFLFLYSFLCCLFLLDGQMLGTDTWRSRVWKNADAKSATEHYESFLAIVFAQNVKILIWSQSIKWISIEIVK